MKPLLILLAALLLQACTTEGCPLEVGDRVKRLDDGVLGEVQSVGLPLINRSKCTVAVSLDDGTWSESRSAGGDGNSWYGSPEYVWAWKYRKLP